MVTCLERSAGNIALDRAVEGGRLGGAEILSLYRLPSEALAAAAHEVRRHKTDGSVATYSIGGNIDYTNVCTVACRFCAFYRARHQDGAFTLSLDDIARQMREIVRLGGTEVLIQGGINPELPFEWYLDLLRMLKREFPAVHVDALSPEEILGLEKLTGRGALSLLAELKEAGLDGMPGAAAEILVDEVRMRTAPTRIMTSDWFRIIDAAQRLHLHNAWISMVIGFGESIEHRVAHLLALRDQQDRALKDYGFGFAAFKVWPVRLDYTRLRGAAAAQSEDEISSEYLRHVAICRLALDNVVNHRAVWRTMGFGVAAQALRGGANDLCGTGSINAINAAITAAGNCLPDPSHSLLGQVRGCIASAGFRPALRDPFYNVVEPCARDGAIV